MKDFKLQDSKSLEDTKIKAGRPKKVESKKATKIVMLYFTESQYNILEEKADAINLSLKDYIKSKL